MPQPEPRLEVLVAEHDVPLRLGRQQPHQPPRVQAVGRPLERHHVGVAVAQSVPDLLPQLIGGQVALVSINDAIAIRVPVRAHLEKLREPYVSRAVPVAALEVNAAGLPTGGQEVVDVDTCGIHLPVVHLIEHDANGGVGVVACVDGDGREPLDRNYLDGACL
jgi:hypothetical protein